MSDEQQAKHALPLLERDSIPAHVKDYLLALALKGTDVQAHIVKLMEREAAKKGFRPQSTAA
jgi:hypothetical protein